MLFIGAKSYKDKRVAKILHTNQVGNAVIYNSPIIIWLMLLLLIISVAYGLLFVFDISKYYPLWIIYFAISYLLSAKLNNSFALTADRLYIINPNFPFRRFSSYALDDIEQITIDSAKRKWLSIFCILGDNYIEIKTADTTKRYFCIGLEEDAFDENWTEKTIEDLDSDLQRKGIKTIFKLATY